MNSNLAGFRQRILSTSFVRHGLARQGLIQALKQSAPIAIGVGFVVLSFDMIAGLDPAQIMAALGAVSMWQWALAALATAVSFWALGRYDAVIHRHFATGVSRRTAMHSGITAIAVSQTTGLGLFVGALIRWRLVPHISLWQATQISAAVAVSFLAGLAVVLAMVSLWAPLPFVGGTGVVMAMAALPLLGFAGLCYMSVTHPTLRIRGKSLRLPSLGAIVAILGLVFADTIAASLALWVLVPGDITLGFGAFFIVFLIAFGGALLSGTPGGVGPFEIAMLSLLPHVPAEPLMAAILGYRAIYYAVPAVIGGIALVLGNRMAQPANLPHAEIAPEGPWLPSRLEQLVFNAPRAEAGLFRQGGKFLLSSSNLPRPQTSVLAARLGQSLVMMGDPLRQHSAAAAASLLHRAARGENRAPVAYKCGARHAVALRKRGYAIWPVSREAWVDTTTYDLATSSRRGLRRKLRKAEKSQVRIVAGAGPGDIAAMKTVAEGWAHQHGGERGFSMGRFCPQYLRAQQVFLAFQGAELIGFISFHTGATEWTLDIMRHVDAPPDGAMYALVNTAIEAAQVAGIKRVSLAGTAGDLPVHAPKWQHRLHDKWMRACGAAGLVRFKSGFAPHWEPLYMAAPSRWSLILGAVDIARAIANPPDLAKPDDTAPESTVQTAEFAPVSSSL